jgi:hypothetical protein
LYLFRVDSVRGRELGETPSIQIGASDRWKLRDRWARMKMLLELQQVTW